MRFDFPTRVEIAAALEPHVLRISTQKGKRTCQFIDPDMTDMRLAEMLQGQFPGLTQGVVSGIRRGLFGNLVTPDATTNLERKLDYIIELLEKRQ